ncbi:MAG: BamA/TamA family outer membrane protein, partial [Planctomycetota bacterium]
SFTLRDSDNDPIPGPDADPPVPGDEYVPGIELDGRIPKVQLPDDLPNPDRWRYVPEGRILDGSIIDRLWVSSFAIPLFFFEEDIGAGGGISITDIDFRNQRRREFAGMFLTYTSEGQQSYRFAWRRWLHHRELDGGGIAQEERSFVSASGGYRRTLTRRFFGFGPDTRERNETSFTDEESSVEFGFQHTYPGHGDDFVMNLGIRAEHRNLSHGEVSDVPDTKNIFPTVFDDADSFDSLWVDFGARYDTRDSQHNPYRGFEIGVFGSSAPAQTGGDVGAIFSLGGSGVIQTPGLFHDGGDDEEEHPPTDVVALGGFVTTVAGNLPFWAIPSLGGSNTLRGYIGNRWTDKVTWHTVAEYRFWVVPRGFTISEKVRIERVGMAVFFELGSVAPHFAALEAKEAKTSYGVSFRASLERQALFRADFGFSPEGFAFTASYGLSF